MFSIIVAAYNAEKHIEKCISSILAQAFPEFEIIVVDDGSSDKTAMLVASRKDQRIRLFRNTRNLGLAATWNFGIAQAKGDFLLFVDADDTLTPIALQTFARVSQELWNFGRVTSTR